MFYNSKSKNWYDDVYFKMHMASANMNDFVYVEDKIMNKLVVDSNRKQMDISTNSDGYPCLVERIITEKQKIQSELFVCRQALLKTKDLLLECYENGEVFKDKYPSIFEERRQNKKRIEELTTILQSME